MASIKIPINKNGKVTLLTAGKYCDRDIDVNVMAGDFWDGYQENGARTDYQSAFAGSWWTEDRFMPKYDIKPVNAKFLFHQSGITGDLREHLEKVGVALDFSATTNFTQAFLQSGLTHIGECDLSHANTVAECFLGCSNLVSIDKLILKADGSQAFGTGAFNGCEALEEIRFQGKVNLSISFASCTKLSRASILSLLEVDELGNSVLGDGRDPGTQTVTLSKTAVNTAFTEDEWEKLIKPHSAWNFSLV